MQQTDGRPASMATTLLAAAASRHVPPLAAPLLAAALAVPLAAQDVTIVDYEPRNTLVVPGNPLTRASFPFVDIHGHQRGERMFGRRHRAPGG